MFSARASRSDRKSMRVSFRLLCCFLRGIATDLQIHILTLFTYLSILLRKDIFLIEYTHCLLYCRPSADEDMNDVSSIKHTCTRVIEVADNDATVAVVKVTPVCVTLEYFLIRRSFCQMSDSKCSFPHDS